MRSRSRHAPESLAGKVARLPPVDSEVLSESRTRYPATRRDPGAAERVLKSGFNSAKIGARVMKGKWIGFPIYTLTLEERATCPRSCRHWRSCFGNVMHFAERFHAGPALERKLEAEVAALAAIHPDGFVVRLHVLGDFYSIGYVALWERLLDQHPELHVFGYTARIDGLTDPIAKALVRLSMANWDRFAMRFSNAPIDECATVSIEHPFQAPADAVICPAQLGKTESCSTCALCWQSRRRVAFLQH